MPKTEKKFIKTKNLIEMEYQQFLSYFEIVTISGISTLISLLIAYFTEQIDVRLLTTGILITMILLVFIDRAIMMRLVQKKEELEELK